VALAPLREPALLLPGLVQALELKEQPGRPLAETLQAALMGRRMLLFLDNAEHLLPDLVTELAPLRAIAGPSIFVTSRERLQLQGEHVYQVPSLNTEDAVDLFLTRAAQQAVSLRRTTAVSELCRRLDELPLALELAAARTPLFSPEQLLERLAQRLDLLKGGRDADPRQQTLRATIQWSYGLLADEEQRLFRQLSVFLGGCTFEAAEEICDAEPDTLQSLLDKSLLGVATARQDIATGCSRRSGTSPAKGSTEAARRRKSRGGTPVGTPVWASTCIERSGTATRKRSLASMTNWRTCEPGSPTRSSAGTSLWRATSCGACGTPG